jgi:hypothetical protein
MFVLIRSGISDDLYAYITGFLDIKEICTFMSVDTGTRERCIHDYVWNTYPIASTISLHYSPSVPVMTRVIASIYHGLGPSMRPEAALTADIQLIVDDMRVQDAALVRSLTRQREVNTQMSKLLKRRLQHVVHDNWVLQEETAEDHDVLWQLNRNNVVDIQVTRCRLRRAREVLTEVRRKLHIRRLFEKPSKYYVWMGV